LADRNILADQAFNSFSAFPDDAFRQTKGIKNTEEFLLMEHLLPYFRRLCLAQMTKAIQHLTSIIPADYFDFIIIDECHRVVPMTKELERDFRLLSLQWV
jgi:type I restriction enzyme R subunit